MWTDCDRTDAQSERESEREREKISEEAHFGLHSEPLGNYLLLMNNHSWWYNGGPSKQLVAVLVMEAADAGSHCDSGP